MKCAPWACTKYGNRLEQPMPAIVVIFSCHILRFSISLKYSASTEKSPQPGHHVGWSAAISFLVSPLRSPSGGVVVLTAGTGLAIKVSLIIVWRLKLDQILRRPAATLVLARSRISFTFQVSPSVLLMPWIFGSQ